MWKRNVSCYCTLIKARELQDRNVNRCVTNRKHTEDRFIVAVSLKNYETNSVCEGRGKKTELKEREGERETSINCPMQ